MTCELKIHSNFGLTPKAKGLYELRSSFGFLRFRKSNVVSRSHGLTLTSNLEEQAIKPLIDSHENGSKEFRVTKSNHLCTNESKTLEGNVIEIHSAQELVDTLLSAGDSLVIIEFYSHTCHGCININPKMSELARENNNVLFLKVNYEKLKTMCYALDVYVLPFFHFYRGLEGRLCRFSCTSATIRKLKDALTKHGANGCNIGPTKGLDESLLLKLASLGEIQFNSTQRDKETT